MDAKTFITLTQFPKCPLAAVNTLYTQGLLAGRPVETSSLHDGVSRRWLYEIEIRVRVQGMEESFSSGKRSAITKKGAKREAAVEVLDILECFLTGRPGVWPGLEVFSLPVS